MMKLKARGDWGWFLLSPSFTKKEAKQLVGKMSIEYASVSDCGNLPLHTQDKVSIIEACKVKR